MQPRGSVVPIRLFRGIIIMPRPKAASPPYKAPKGPLFQGQAPHGPRQASQYPQEERATPDGQTTECGPSEAKYGLESLSATPGVRLVRRNISVS